MPLNEDILQYDDRLRYLIVHIYSLRNNDLCPLALLSTPQIRLRPERDPRIGVTLLIGALGEHILFVFRGAAALNVHDLLVLVYSTLDMSVLQSGTSVGHLPLG